MGKQFEELSDKHIEFIGKQNVFFVATAADTGRVNLSPKGGDALRVINSHTIAWLNLTGSGNESASHVLKNPRMTIMFCAFEGAPLILRAYGTARALHKGDELWQEYIDRFPPNPGARQVFLLDIDMVQASCGKSVPFFQFESERTELSNWAEKQGEKGIENYWLKKNQRSIDGFETEIAQRSGIKTEDQI